MKRLLSGILTVCLLCALVAAPASAAETRSVNQHYGTALRLYHAGLMQGTGMREDGVTPTFSLERQVTRAEAITMLVRALGKEEAAASAPTAPFTDVPAWAAKYVNYAYANGITKGISTTAFGSNRLITREEYIVMCDRVLGYDTSLSNMTECKVGFLNYMYTMNDPEFATFLRGDMVYLTNEMLETPYANWEEGKPATPLGTLGALGIDLDKTGETYVDPWPTYDDFEYVREFADFIEYDYGRYPQLWGAVCDYQMDPELALVNKDGEVVYPAKGDKPFLVYFVGMYDLPEGGYDTISSTANGMVELAKGNYFSVYDEYMWYKYRKEGKTWPQQEVDIYIVPGRQDLSDELFWEWFPVAYNFVDRDSEAVKEFYAATGGVEEPVIFFEADGTPTYAVSNCNSYKIVEYIDEKFGKYFSMKEIIHMLQDGLAQGKTRDQAYQEFKDRSFDTIPLNPNKKVK